jgi:hypothetical protein
MDCSGGKYLGDPPGGPGVQESSIMGPAQYWPLLLAVVAVPPRTDLPTWQKTKPNALLSGGRAADIIDDDIPF